MAELSLNACPTNISDVVRKYVVQPKDNITGGLASVYDSKTLSRLDDLGKYADRSSVGKQELIYDMFLLLKKVFNLKQDPKKMSKEEMIKLLKEKIPSPTAWSINKKDGIQEKVCESLVKGINEIYQRTVIPESASAKEKCRMVSEVLYSLFSCVNTEFVAISADIQQTLRNLEMVSDIIDKIDDSMLNEAMRYADSGSARRFVSINEAKKELKARQSQLHTLLSNLVGNVISPTQKILINQLKDHKDFTGIVSDLSDILGTDAFGDNLAYLISGVVSVAESTYLVDKALRELGIGASEYKRVSTGSDLRDLLTSALKSPKNAKKPLVDLMKAYMAIQANNVNKKDISTYLGGMEGEIQEFVRDAEEVSGGDEEEGGVYGGYYGSATGGNTNMVREVLDRISGLENNKDLGSPFAGRSQSQRNSIKRQYKEHENLRERYFKEVEHALQSKYNIIVGELGKISHQFGTTIPITSEVRFFMDQIRNFRRYQPDRENLHLALLGAKTGVSALEEKNRYLDTLMGVSTALDGLVKTASAAQFKPLHDAVNGLMEDIMLFQQRAADFMGPQNVKIYKPVASTPNKFMGGAYWGGAGNPLDMSENEITIVTNAFILLEPLLVTKMELLKSIEGHFSVHGITHQKAYAYSLRDFAHAITNLSSLCVYDETFLNTKINEAPPGGINYLRPKMFDFWDIVTRLQELYLKSATLPAAGTRTADEQAVFDGIALNYEKLFMNADTPMSDTTSDSFMSGTLAEVVKKNPFLNNLLFPIKTDATTVIHSFTLSKHTTLVDEYKSGVAPARTDILATNLNAAGLRNSADLNVTSTEAFLLHDDAKAEEVSKYTFDSIILPILRQAVADYKTVEFPLEHLTSILKNPLEQLQNFNPYNFLLGAPDATLASLYESCKGLVLVDDYKAWQEAEVTATGTAGGTYTETIYRPLVPLTLKARSTALATANSEYKTNIETGGNKPSGAADLPTFLTRLNAKFWGLTSGRLGRVSQTLDNLRDALKNAVIHMFNTLIMKVFNDHISKLSYSAGNTEFANNLVRHILTTAAIPMTLPHYTATSGIYIGAYSVGLAGLYTHAAHNETIVSNNLHWARDDLSAVNIMQTMTPYLFTTMTLVRLDTMCQDGRLNGNVLPQLLGMHTYNSNIKNELDHFLDAAERRDYLLDINNLHNIIYNGFTAAAAPAGATAFFSVNIPAYHTFLDAVHALLRAGPDVAYGVDVYMTQDQCKAIMGAMIPANYNDYIKIVNQLLTVITTPSTAAAAAVGLFSYYGRYIAVLAALDGLIDRASMVSKKEFQRIAVTGTKGHGSWGAMTTAENTFRGTINTAAEHGIADKYDRYYIFFRRCIAGVYETEMLALFDDIETMLDKRPAQGSVSAAVADLKGIISDRVSIPLQLKEDIGKLRDLNERLRTHTGIGNYAPNAGNDIKNEFKEYDAVIASRKDPITLLQSVNPRELTNPLVQRIFPVATPFGKPKKGGNAELVLKNAFGGMNVNGYFKSLERAIAEMDYYYRIMNIKTGLRNATSKFEENTKNYVDVMGEEAASMIDRINERFDALVSSLRTETDELDELWKTYTPNPIFGKHTGANIKGFITAVGGAPNPIKDGITEYKEGYLIMLEYIRSANKEMIEAMQAIDIHLSKFTKELQTNPDLSKELLQLIEPIMITHKFFTDKSGDMLVQVFETFLQFTEYADFNNTMIDLTAATVEGYRADARPANANVDLREHYYRWIHNNAAAPAVDSNYVANHMIPLFMKGSEVQQFLEKLEKSFRMNKALENVFAIFTKLNPDSTIQSFMEPAQILRAFIKYSIASSISVGYLIAHNGAIAPSIAATNINTFSDVPSNFVFTSPDGGGAVIAAAAIGATATQTINGIGQYRIGQDIQAMHAKMAIGLRVAGENGWVVLNHALGGGNRTAKIKYMNPYESPDQLNMDQFFILGVKSLVSKVMVMIGTYTLFRKPSLGASQNEWQQTIMASHPIRQILGGAEESLVLNSPEIHSDITELYIRIPLLAEWYRDIFQYTAGAAGTAVAVSMIPQVENVWNDLVKVIFVEMRTIEDGGYPRNFVDRIITCINRAYSHYKAQYKDNLCTNIIHEFIQEINRRYGVFMKSEIDQFHEENTKANDTNFSTSSEERLEYNIIDIDSPSITSAAPSDKYLKFQTKRGISASSNRTKLDSFYAAVRDFRRRIENSLVDTSQNYTTYTSEFDKQVRFSEMINNIQKKLASASSNEEKYKIIYGNLHGIDKFSDIDESKLILLHETVVTPLTTLFFVYRILNEYNKRLVSMNTEKMDAIADELFTAHLSNGAAAARVPTYIEVATRLFNENRNLYKQGSSYREAMNALRDDFYDINRDYQSFMHYFKIDIRDIPAGAPARTEIENVWHAIINNNTTATLITALTPFNPLYVSRVITLDNSGVNLQSIQEELFNNYICRGLSCIPFADINSDFSIPWSLNYIRSTNAAIDQNKQEVYRAFVLNKRELMNDVLTSIMKIGCDMNGLVEVYFNGNESNNRYPSLSFDKLEKVCTALLIELKSNLSELRRSLPQAIIEKYEKYDPSDTSLSPNGVSVSYLEEHLFNRLFKNLYNNGLPYSNIALKNIWSYLTKETITSITNAGVVPAPGTAFMINQREQPSYCSVISKFVFWDQLRGYDTWVQAPHYAPPAVAADLLYYQNIDKYKKQFIGGSIHDAWVNGIQARALNGPNQLELTKFPVISSPITGNQKPLAALSGTQEQIFSMFANLTMEEKVSDGFFDSRFVFKTRNIVEPSMDALIDAIIDNSDVNTYFTLLEFHRRTTFEDIMMDWIISNVDNTSIAGVRMPTLSSYAQVMFDNFELGFGTKRQMGTAAATPATPNTYQARYILSFGGGNIKTVVPAGNPERDANFPIAVAVDINRAITHFSNITRNKKDVRTHLIKMLLYLKNTNILASSVILRTHPTLSIASALKGISSASDYTNEFKDAVDYGIQLINDPAVSNYFQLQAKLRTFGDNDKLNEFLLKVTNHFAFHPTFRPTPAVLTLLGYDGSGTTELQTLGNEVRYIYGIQGLEDVHNPVFSANTGLVIKLNMLISRYVNCFMDPMKQIIYKPLVDFLVAEGASDAIMNGNTINDCLYEIDSGAGDIGKKDSIKIGMFNFEPPPNTSLLASIAFGLRGLYASRKSSSGGAVSSLFLEENLSAIESYQKEVLRAYLPMFDKEFDMLITQAVFLKEMLETLQLKVKKVYSTNIQDKFIYNNKDIAGFTKQMKNEAMSEGTRKGYLISILNNVIRVASSVQKCIATASRDLSDLPIFLETYKGSVAQYTETNGQVPFTPLSQITAAYNPFLLDARNGETNNVEFNQVTGEKINVFHPPFVPSHKNGLGTRMFEFTYGLRGVLNPKNKDLFKYMPSLEELIPLRNAPVEKKGGADNSNLVLNTVILSRYVIDVLYMKDFLLDNSTHSFLKDVTYRNFGNMTLQSGRTHPHSIGRTVLRPGAAALPGVAPPPIKAAIVVAPTDSDVIAYEEFWHKMDNVIGIVSNPNKRQSIYRFLSALTTTPNRLWNFNRNDLRRHNILDLNINPINVHALQRELPFVNVMNFAYTFDQIAKQMIGIDYRGAPLAQISGSRVANDPYNGTILNPTTVNTAEDAMVLTLLYPLGWRPLVLYCNHIKMIMSGNTNISLARPKYLSDQLWNKVLLNQIGTEVRANKVQANMKYSYHALNRTGLTTLANLSTAAADRIAANLDPSTTGINAVNSATAVPLAIAAVNNGVVPNGTDSLSYLDRNGTIVPLTPQKFAGAAILPGPYAQTLAYVGYLRYNTHIVRLLEFYTNLQRVVRLFLQRQLQNSLNPVMQGLDILDENTTEFGHDNRTLDLDMYH